MSSLTGPECLGFQKHCAMTLVVEFMESDSDKSSISQYRSKLQNSVVTDEKSDLFDEFAIISERQQNKTYALIILPRGRLATRRPLRMESGK
jgi:hypothetical protein